MRVIRARGREEARRSDARDPEWHSLSADPRRDYLASCHAILLCAHAHVSCRVHYLTDRARVSIRGVTQTEEKGGGGLARCGLILAAWSRV